MYEEVKHFYEITDSTVLRYIKLVQCLNLKGTLLLYLEQKKLCDYWFEVIDGLRSGKHSYLHFTKCI